MVKGRLNASIIPANKFSPISLKANPRRIAVTPAPANNPETAPLRPTLFKKIEMPMEAKIQNKVS